MTQLLDKCGGNLRGHSVIQYNIHSFLVDVRDEKSPVFNLSVMMIKKSEIERPVPIARPWHVDERAASEVDALGRNVSRFQGISLSVVKP